MMTDFSFLAELYLQSLIPGVKNSWSNFSWHNTLLYLQLFSDVAYKARDREDLIAGIDEFLDEVIVLPPGEWDPKIRIEPPKKIPSADKRWTSLFFADSFQKPHHLHV